MKKFINVYIKSDYDIVILRLSVIIIFMLFGTYKWFDFEVMALKPLISPTWLNILYIMFGVHGGSYFLGIVETITFLALSIGFFRPAADDDFPLTELCGGGSRTLGIAHWGKQPPPGREKPRYKVAGIQQDLRLCLLERPAHPRHCRLAGLVFAVADGVFGLHGTVGLCGLHHKGVGTDEAAQQTQIDPQQVGKALPGTTKVSFPGGLFHRARF